MHKTLLTILILLSLTIIVIHEGKCQTLGWIGYGEELVLQHEDDRCGEWGGDVEKITIYRRNLEGPFVAKLERTMKDCTDPYGIKNTPKKIVGVEVVLSTEEQELVHQCIEELRVMKMTLESGNYPVIGHSGILNFAVLSDSSFLIKDYPSKNWERFEVLKKILNNK